MASLGSLFTILVSLALVLSPVSSARAQSPPTNRNRSVRVDRQRGQVIVISNETGETILTFGLSNTFSARAFLIDEGETVAIAQSLSMNPPFEEVTTFLDIDTGEEITRLPERVYGFSEDESLLVTRAPQEMAIHSYPSLTQRCRLTGEYWRYPTGLRLSPDHRFLLVYFVSKDLDTRIPTFSSVISWIQLFDIEECERVSEFPRLWTISDPVFSDDSRFLYLGEERVCWHEFSTEGNCRFNLTTYEVEFF